MDQIVDLTQDPQPGQALTPQTINDSDDEDGAIVISSDESEDDASFSEDDNEPGMGNGFIQLGGGKYHHLTFKEVECKRAFHNAILCKSFEPKEQVQDLASVLHWLKRRLSTELPALLAQFHGLRAWVSMVNTYDNITSDEEVELPIQTHSQLVMNDWAIPDLIHNLQLEIIGRNSELIRGRSDLTFVRTERLTIKVAQWDLLAGRKWQKLPPMYENKRCFTNIMNDDECCFVYSICAYLLKREAGLERTRKFVDHVNALARGETVEEFQNPTTEEMELQEDPNDIPPSPTLKNPFNSNTNS